MIVCIVALPFYMRWLGYSWTRGVLDAEFAYAKYIKIQTPDEGEEDVYEIVKRTP